LHTFLLVEDDELVCELLRRMLISSGRRILTATDAEAALRHADSTRIDLLVTDFGCTSGLAAADRLRAAQPEVRVLYMRDWTDNSPSAELRNADVVRKPFTVDELEAAVAGALGGHP
jgi:DNA-binding response OmpR family regulator